MRPQRIQRWFYITLKMIWYFHDHTYIAALFVIMLRIDHDFSGMPLPLNARGALDAMIRPVEGLFCTQLLSPKAIIGSA